MHLVLPGDVEGRPGGVGAIGLRCFCEGVEAAGFFCTSLVYWWERYILREQVGGRLARPPAILLDLRFLTCIYELSNFIPA